MKLRFLIPILLALAPAAFAQSTSGEGIQQVSASPTGACTVVSRMQYNYVAGSFWGCKNGTWTQVSGGGSMTWPTTPGVAACSGTPCTAWGTSLTAPVGSTALAGLGANTFTGNQTIGTTLLDGTVTGTLGTAAVKSIGTSGATVPLLNGGNTWSGANVFTGDTRVWGTGSGDFELTYNVLATGSNNPHTAPMFLSNQYWTGSASAEDAWLLQSQMATGTNGASTVVLQHSFGSTGVSNFLVNLANGTPYNATSGANFSSPVVGVGGNYWNGSASLADTWSMQDVLGSGTNPTTTLTFTHSGSSGTASVAFPGAASFGGGATFGGQNTGATSYRVAADAIAAEGTVNSATTGVKLGTNQAVVFSSTINFYGTADASISRIGANVVGVGTSGLSGSLGGYWQGHYKANDGTTGATLTFATGDGKTCTVKDGLITGCI